VVDQWRFSKHFFMSTNTSDAERWTSRGACGNCHSVDGLEHRTAGRVLIADGGTPPNDVARGHLSYRTAGGSVAEAEYPGQGRAAIVHCSTCHQFTSANDPHNTGRYTSGQAPLRVASGPDDESFIEKSPAADAGTTGQSAGKYRAGNTCVFCHKSRKDPSFYITASNRISSVHWGPHAGPQADIFSGKGGYHFSGNAYGTSQHSTVANGCVSCHMPGVTGNGNVPDHSMHPRIEYCRSCHTTYTGTSFDIQGGMSVVSRLLRDVQAILNTRGLITRASTAPYVELSAAELADGAYDHDESRPTSLDGGTNTLDAATAGALYNYLLVARSKDLGVHNPTYAKQLLFDSYQALAGGPPPSMPNRPQ